MPGYEHCATTGLMPGPLMHAQGHRQLRLFSLSLRIALTSLDVLALRASAKSSCPRICLKPFQVWKFVRGLWCAAYA